ncbi:MAG: hypothetical protein SPI52_05550, partial [Bacilli bacterium]|nr:hypothetical protein [Bacilli bacterium]
MANYSSEIYYTLSFTKNTSNTAYATNYEVTINDKKWSVPGNQGLGDHVKIGGKLSSETTRRIYSIDGISGNVGKIIVAHGDKDPAITVVSLTIKAFATAENCKEGTNHVSEKLVKNVESEIV